MSVRRFGISTSCESQLHYPAELGSSPPINLQSGGGDPAGDWADKSLPRIGGGRHLQCGKLVANREPGSDSEAPKVS